MVYPLFSVSFFFSFNMEQCDKIRCELLILDRGFDCISPVLHEFTFQAMAYDTLNIKDDIFSYSDEETDGEKVNEISLSEEDSLWGRLRHEHIANVSKYVFLIVNYINIFLLLS